MNFVPLAAVKTTHKNTYSIIGASFCKLFIYVLAFLFFLASCYAMLEVTENSLTPQTYLEENSVPLRRRLIKEIKEGLVKDGLTDLPTGTI